MKDTYAVIDFETTGLTPGADRAIEVGAILVSGDKIVDRYQSLMNPGKKISSFIESYTGITNTMLEKASSNRSVILDLKKFIKDYPLVAHNASFDKKFLDHELKLAGQKNLSSFACSLLVARRVYNSSPNHKLKTLIELNKIKVKGDFHRALADAEMTTHLWIKMQSDIKNKYKIPSTSFEFMYNFSKTSKNSLDEFVASYK